jgi:predicted component of type VI protein secretion system
VPQLDNFQRQSRIRRRIDELEQGVEVAARDIENLLTTEEQEQLAAAWAAHSILGFIKGKQLTISVRTK